MYLYVYGCDADCGPKVGFSRINYSIYQNISKSISGISNFQKTQTPKTIDMKKELFQKLSTVKYSHKKLYAGNHVIK